MLFITSEGTETFKFVQRTGIGFCSPASNEARLANGMIALMEDQNLRARYGASARAYAERYFNLAEYQRWLYDKLVEAVAVGGRS
jgi:glycosyltransferase involved in cell wall biosynthesis